MTTYTAVAGFDGVPYATSTYTGATGLQVCRLFHPGGTRPADGWPCLVILNCSGFTTTWLESTIGSTPTGLNSALAYAALESGVAVLMAAGTVARSPGAAFDPGEPGSYFANPNDEATTDLSDTDIPSTNTYGPAYAGNGLVIPDEFEMPATFSGTVHPYRDRSRPMILKDAVALAQFVKDKAGLMQLDTSKLFAFGRSASANAQSWVFWKSDLAHRTWGEAGTLYGQDAIDTSTVYAGFLCYELPAYWPVFLQAIKGSGGPDFISTWFPTIGDASATYSDFDFGAIALGETSPTNLGVILDLQKAASALHFVQVGQVESVAQNRRVYILSNTTDDGGDPYTEAAFDTSFEPHTIWSGVALMQQLSTEPNNMRFVTSTTTIKSSIDSGVSAEYLPTVVELTSQTDDAVDWMIAQIADLTVGPTTHYADLEDDVLTLIKRLGQDIGSSTPLVTTAEATQILASVEAMIDTALDAYGLDVPVTTPTHFVYTLRMIAAWGAAYHIVESYMLNDPSPGLQAVADFWRVQFEAGIESLRDGTAIPRSLASPVGRPASHLYDYPDADPDLGVNANPAFTRGRDW